MITGNMFKGLFAFSSFIDDYKSRGHDLNPALYIGLVVMYVVAILLTPLMLFIDLMVWIYLLFEKKYQKEQFIGKNRKRRKK